MGVTSGVISSQWDLVGAGQRSIQGFPPKAVDSPARNLSRSERESGAGIPFLQIRTDKEGEEEIDVCIEIHHLLYTDRRKVWPLFPLRY